MIMDVVRSCYEVDFRFFKEDDSTTRVRWFFCDKDAQFFPGLHVFGSRNWDHDDFDYSGIGEQFPGNRTYSKGKNLCGVKGENFFGNKSFFETGVSGTAADYSIVTTLPNGCCPFCFPLGGGVVVGGQAVVTSGKTVTTGCGSCTDQPIAWRLDLPGDVVNNGCNACNLANGSPVFLYWIPAGSPDPAGEISNGCYWASPTVGIACPNQPGRAVQAFWELKFDTGGTFQWFLWFRMGLETAGVFQPISQIGFNCNGLNTFVNPTWDANSCLSALSANLRPA